MKFVVFSDIDHTLTHLKSDRDDLVSFPGEKMMMSQEALELIEDLRKHAEFALISGRRKSSLDRVGHTIGHDLAIIEHGCVILDGENERQDWKKELGLGSIEKDPNAKLWQYEEKIHSLGFKTDSAGRLGSFRIYKDHVDQLQEQEKQEIEEMVLADQEEWQVKTTRNRHWLDIIPLKGGKAAAISFLQKGADTIGLGDDFNDLDMLKLVKHPMCPSHAKNAVQDLVLQRKGYISPSSEHEATVQMLKKALSLVE